MHYLEVKCYFHNHRIICKTNLNAKNKKYMKKKAKQILFWFLFLDQEEMYAYQDKMYLLWR